MDKKTILQNLEDIAKKMSIEVRYDEEIQKPGICKIKGKQVLVLNSSLSEKEKIKILSKELSKLNLNNIYLLPLIREIINKEKKSS